MAIKYVLYESFCLWDLVREMSRINLFRKTTFTIFK